VSKPRLLDGYCGAGGCTKGYQRAGFYVVGVDIEPQPHYCGDEFHQGDAIQFIREHGHKYDVISTSPPCQRYSQGTRTEARGKHPDMVAATRAALQSAGKPYVIENVRDAPLQASLLLCGTMFGLRVIRHRYFECEPMLWVSPAPCAHIGTVGNGDYVTVAGHGGNGSNAYPVWCDAMRIDWMNKDELKEAIPPVYAEYIGKRLLERLDL
jgi:DNA (cytosine-5)-methyltransferase 1